MYIDINCDLGETDPATGPGNDEAVMPFISSARIANVIAADLTLIAQMRPGDIIWFKEA
ncbi:MAG: hypothetical protein GX622_13695 [Bacteroidales bacterium]|nr:hypothetical protein [Bacteroidales bacterium]